MTTGHGPRARRGRCPARPVAGPSWQPPTTGRSGGQQGDDFGEALLVGCDRAVTRGFGTPPGCSMVRPKSRNPAGAAEFASAAGLGPANEALDGELVGDGVAEGEPVGDGVPEGEPLGDGVGLTVGLGVVLGLGLGEWLARGLGLQLADPVARERPLGRGVLPGCDADLAELLPVGTAPLTEPGPGPLLADGEMTCGRAVKAR